MLIGVELLETLKAYVKKDVIHVRVVLEVALIAMARKVIIEEPNTVPSLTLFGDCCTDLCLGYSAFLRAAGKARNRSWDFVRSDKTRWAITDVERSRFAAELPKHSGAKLGHHA